jgi:hypothetical protein
MTVKEIALEWLKANGFTGLCCQDCGCGIDDLMPCVESDIGECVPAHKCDCTTCAKAKTDDCLLDGELDGEEFVFAAEKCWQKKEAEK